MAKKAYMKEAAKELGLTQYQLRRMTKEGKMPYLTSGNRYIYDLELCKEFLKNEALKNTQSVEPAKQYGVLRKIGCN